MKKNAGGKPTFPDQWNAERGQSTWKMALGRVKAVVGRWMDTKWVLFATLGVPWTPSSVKRRKTKAVRREARRNAENVEAHAEGFATDIRRIG
ncbi:hypothetical protein CYMTET_25726 [Cymbomonas tetramitiformis]|uniref:Uncharacterized protein n=1 Tax=Cymbomonas tetramitiformis TaxID=36881 RepID=A0AAE0FTM1_9CHLO|nr:hypothetical protein CYMTET_25726 [Cymbomonas tetramitiformis]